MIRTLENCKVIHYYGMPAQNNGVCEGVMRNGSLLEKCQDCYLHDIKNAVKICIVCGKEFISPNPKAKICSAECKEARKNEIKKVKRHKDKKKTLDEVLKEIDEYNRAHGTHLTYGKYKEMKYCEELRKNRERGKHK